MRHFQILSDPVVYRTDLALYQSKPLMLAVFKAFVEQKLHTETNSHDRLAFFCL